MVEVGPRDGLQNEHRARVDGGQDRIYQPAERRRVCRSSRCRRSSAEMGAADGRRRGGVCRYHAAAGHALHRARAQSRRARPRARGRALTNCDLRRVVRDVQPEEHQSKHRRIVGHLRGRSANARSPAGFASADTCRRRSATPLKATWRPLRVADVAGRLVDLGVFEVAISDTIGVAHPGRFPRSRCRARNACRSKNVALHFHDTRGRRSPTSSRRSRRGSRRSTRPQAGLEVVRTRRALPEISRQTI